MDNTKDKVDDELQDYLDEMDDPQYHKNNPIASFIDEFNIHMIAYLEQNPFADGKNINTLRESILNETRFAEKVLNEEDKLRQEAEFRKKKLDELLSDE